MHIFVGKHNLTTLSKEDGYLLVTFPNFKGKIQSFLHNWLDKKNFSYHYQGAMDIRQYRKICLKNNFEIIFCGYWGGFDFWLGGDAHPTFSQQYFLRFLYKMARHGSKIPSYSWYSPYCGIVAKSVFGNFSFYSYKKACGQKKTVRGSKNSRRLSNGTPAI